LEQHFSLSEQSLSPLQASTQIPKPVGLGHAPGFPNAAGKKIKTSYTRNELFLNKQTNKLACATSKKLDVCEHSNV